MTAVTALRTLVLNADYRPLATFPPSFITAQEAITMVYRDRAHVVEEWDHEFHSPSRTIRVPKVVARHEYVHITAAPKFCRRNVILRDRFRCQYCGERFDSHELTFDHVVPRSRGGQTVWDNILMACVACNTRKQHTMPNYSGRRATSKTSSMRPLKEPRQPTWLELMRAGLDQLDDATLDDFRSYLYWSQELHA